MDKAMVIAGIDYRKYYSERVGSLNGNGKAQATGCCPFHDDQHPSFSVNLDNGLWTCRTGCGQGDVFSFEQKLNGLQFHDAVESIGKWRGLTCQQTVGRTIIRRFRWTDAQGNVAWKLRWNTDEPGKKYTWAQDPDGKIPGKGIGAFTLYRLETLSSPTTIIIAEGERDVETINGWLDELHLTGMRATCTPNGAGDVKPQYLTSLHEKAAVYASGDNDEAGKPYVDKLAKVLEGKGPTLHPLHVPEGWKDWTEWKESGMGNAEAFSRLLDEAVVLTIPSPLDESPDQDTAHCDLTRAVIGYNEMLVLNLPERRRHLAWLGEGSNVMVFGPRGVGKTLFQLGVAVSLTIGKSLLGWNISEPVGVLYIDGEMQLDELCKRATALMTCEPQAPLLFLTSELVYHRLARDLILTSDMMRDSVVKILDAHPEIRVIILDNISCLFSGIDEDSKRHWEPINAWLIRLRHRGLATVLVHHAGKRGQQRGTSGREDSLDTVIQLDRPSSYDAREGCHFELRFTKARSVKGEVLAPLDVRLEDHSGQLVWIYKTLEESQTDHAKRLYEEGVRSPSDLAEELGCSKGYASKMLKKFRAEGGV